MQQISGYGVVVDVQPRFAKVVDGLFVPATEGDAAWRVLGVTEPPEPQLRGHMCLWLVEPLQAPLALLKPTPLQASSLAGIKVELPIQATCGLVIS